MVRLEWPDMILAAVGGCFIALSSTLNLFMKGRITGLSGIFYTLIRLDFASGLTWKFAFFCGMILASYPLFLASDDG